MRCNNDLFKKINHELIQIFQVIQGNIEKLAVEHHIDDEGWDAIDEIYGAIRRGHTLSKNIAEIEKVPEEIKNDGGSYYLGNGETILFVDDDKQICRLYEAMLEAFNFNVLIAREGKTAIDIFCNGFQNIDLCVLDIILADMTGYDCYKEIIKCSEEEPRVILASGSIYAFDNEELNKKAKATLNKPFTLLQLTTAIKTALND